MILGMIEKARVDLTRPYFGEVLLYDSCSSEGRRRIILYFFDIDP
jgi:hypothetical protein